MMLVMVVAVAFAVFHLIVVYLFILESQKDKIKMIIKIRSTGALLSTSSSQQKYFKDYYQVYLLHALVICNMHFRMVI